MPGVSIKAAMAGGIRMPDMRWEGSLGRAPSALAVRTVREGDVRNLGYCIPGYQATADAMVPRNVAGHQPEKWCKRHGGATSTRDR